ncbi:MAG TPA: hypothetical protein VLL98_05245 [Rickettsiales bacterium]|nr:hypothetical protein [Rickettsiales bacterium]
MKKYAKVINETTKQCNVGLGTNEKYYKSLDMTEQNVEQAYNGSWYLEGYVPEKPQELANQEEILELKQYLAETDWYYARQLETGETIPNNIKQKRIESRNRINELQGTESIENTTTESEITDESETTDESTETTTDESTTESES